MQRTLVINQIEPAPLGLRLPQGVDLDLTIEFRDINGAATDPTPYAGQLILRPRSTTLRQKYTVETYDPTNGLGRVLVGGGDLRDPLGYSLELWSRLDGKPRELLAQGTVAIRFGSYASTEP